MSHKQEYDSSGKGSSALFSALLRNARAEIAAWLGQAVAAIYHDYDKFFDSVDIIELLSEAIFTSFPPVQLALALQQHLAPRVIQVAGFSGEPVLVYISILAGCRFSVAMTRSLLMRAMQKTIKEHPETKTNVHVDDTAMLVTGSSRSYVYDTIVPTALSFAKQVRKLRLTLSSKGVIVCSDSSMAKYMQKELKLHGIDYQTELHARDLGISFTAAQSSPRVLLNKRFSRTKVRTDKTIRIAQLTRKARVLFSGSVYPARTHGHQASGFDI